MLSAGHSVLIKAKRTKEPNLFETQSVFRYYACKRAAVMEGPDDQVILCGTVKEVKANGEFDIAFGFGCSLDVCLGSDCIATGDDVSKCLSVSYSGLSGAAAALAVPVNECQKEKWEITKFLAAETESKEMIEYKVISEKEGEEEEQVFSARDFHQDLKEHVAKSLLQSLWSISPQKEDHKLQVWRQAGSMVLDTEISVVANLSAAAIDLHDTLEALKKHHYVLSATVVNQKGTCCFFRAPISAFQQLFLEAHYRISSAPTHSLVLYNGDTMVFEIGVECVVP